MYHRFRRTFQSHGTSIWDQSLFKAWGSIMHGLIPNLSTIESILHHLVEITGAEEIVLFERTTFLIVTSVQSDVGERNPHKDRFEKLSNILKIFKASLSCVFPSFLIFLSGLSFPQPSSLPKEAPFSARLWFSFLFFVVLSAYEAMTQDIHTNTNSLSPIQRVPHQNPTLQSHHRAPDQ